MRLPKRNWLQSSGYHQSVCFGAAASRFSLADNLLQMVVEWGLKPQREPRNYVASLNTFFVRSATDFFVCRKISISAGDSILAPLAMFGDIDTTRAGPGTSRRSIRFFDSSANFFAVCSVDEVSGF